MFTTVFQLLGIAIFLAAIAGAVFLIVRVVTLNRRVTRLEQERARDSVSNRES